MNDSPPVGESSTTRRVARWEGFCPTTTAVVARLLPIALVAVSV